MNNDLKKASQLQKLCWIYLEELSTHFSFLHKTGSAAAPGCFGPGSAGWVPPLGAPHPWLMRQAATPATAHQSQPLPLATLKAQVSKGQLDLCYCCKQPSQPKTRRKKRKKKGPGGGKWRHETGLTSDFCRGCRWPVCTVYLNPAGSKDTDVVCYCVISTEISFQRGAVLEIN